jgi:hypothetical protein
MSNVLRFPTKEPPLCTSDAATGQQMAVEALVESGHMPSRDDAAVEWADNLMDCINDCTQEEARNFLAGFLSEAFTFFPPVKTVEQG